MIPSPTNPRHRVPYHTTCRATPRGSPTFRHSSRTTTTTSAWNSSPLATEYAALSVPLTPFIELIQSLTVSCDSQEQMKELASAMGFLEKAREDIEL